MTVQRTRSVTADRQWHVDQAVANEALEHLEVSEDSRRIADRYVVGTASARTAAAQIRQRYGIVAPAQ
ncbi:MAG: antitoxin VbhA family protein [Bifidobacteriaceae bacterium]|jgi:hypothetical protein|nr:antitoxin VbhA family protein [Bifidobacteriaceae bacterium]